MNIMQAMQAVRDGEAIHRGCWYKGNSLRLVNGEVMLSISGAGVRLFAPGPDDWLADDYCAYNGDRPPAGYPDDERLSDDVARTKT